MTEYLNEVIIIGGGQAGLSTSYFLKQNGVDHLVLDKGKVGDTWRLKRWDSFCLVTQNWQCQLPGFPYKGDQPEGFMGRDEIVEYLEQYTDHFNPPIKNCCTVNKLYFDDSKSLYVVETTDGELYADNIIIASGTFQKNRIPEYAGNLSSDITQLHSSEYKNPNSLPDGGVLVVGSGQSGCQIAEDLKNAGKNVYLAIGRAPRVPRRYRGKDILQWADQIGMYDIKIDDHPEGKSLRFKAHPHLSGRDGGHTINLRKLGKEGFNLLGRITNIDGYMVFVKDDIQESLNNADEAAAKIKKSIDEYIDKHGISAPLEPPENIEWEPTETIEKLDLMKEDIKTVIWATGYRHDYSWIDIPVFDDRGYPEYERGVTNFPGLYFVGLHWMHTWGSGLFYSVGRDAEYIADQIIWKKLNNIK